MRQRDLSRVPSVDARVSLHEALLTLEDSMTSALLVMKGERAVGLLTERDFIRWAVDNSNQDLRQTPVTEAMTRRIVYVTPDYRIGTCMVLMTKLHIRHLPVLETGIPVAMLGMRHIMEAMSENEDQVINRQIRYLQDGEE